MISTLALIGIFAVGMIGLFGPTVIISRGLKKKD